MNWLRKYFGKARKSPVKSHESNDDNDQLEEHSESESDIEYTRRKRNFEDTLNDFKLKMLNLMKEIAIFCIIFGAYTAITNDPPKISKAPAAYPFFPKYSYVSDWYQGQLIEAVEHARTTDISFIMFYAPWDAESQVARKEFQAAAKYMHKNIIFSAINCWQPNSECRTQYNKVYRWPVLIAYPTFGNGIQYNGPIRAPHMISFLQKLMMPVKRFTEDIFDFEEAFLVAELDTLPGSVDYSYNVYYFSALKYLEVDRLARVTFYVKPVKTSHLKMSLHMWDHVFTKEFQPSEFKVEKIINWVLRNLKQASGWAAPSGSKSMVLADYMQPGPSLILFTPKNPLQKIHDYYLMLQEVAQEYKNCDDYILNFNIPDKRIRNRVEYKSLKKSCVPNHKYRKPQIIHSVITSNTSNLKNPRVKIDLDCESLLNKIFYIGDTYKNDGRLEIFSHLSMAWEENLTTVEVSDPMSMENLAKIMHKEKCRNFLLAEKTQPAIFEVQTESTGRKPNISGLSCKTNQSLEMVAMDSVLYFNFAEKLGIDLSKNRDKSAVVIINPKMEAHYILEGPITSVNLRNFIYNFTHNKLQRSLNSTVDVISKNTHSYTIKDSLGKKPMIFVQELNSRNFLSTALKKNKAVIVMYYSKHCSYCNGISYNFLTLARKLSFLENLKFTRIDGDLNILPWEYTMENFPTILFFPANRKSETRVFPSGLPITVPNLLGFILNNLEPNLRIQAMYSLCLHSQLEKEKQLCFSLIYNETLSLIEDTLKVWRKSNNRQRQTLLHNLKQLRQLQFLFNHSPNNYRVIHSYFKKLNSKVMGDYNLEGVLKKIC